MLVPDTNGGTMRRVDWFTILGTAVTGALSVSLIVAGFLTSGNAANVLIGIGISVAVGCIILVIQVVHIVGREQRESFVPQQAYATPPNPTGQIDRSGGSQTSSAASMTASQHTDRNSVRLFRAVSATPSITDLAMHARKEVLAMVVSGRNFLQPKLYHTILEKMRDPENSAVFRLLALNHFSDNQYVEARTQMMDMRRGQEFSPLYRKDFDTLREYTAQVTIEDPTRRTFDVRFYSQMPTTYFYIVDGVLYLSFLLSKPISSSPMVVISPTDGESRAFISAFRSHFEHYWNSSRFFVTLIGLTDDGRTLLVKNRKRGFEWPTGFIEPNEDLATGAAREFREETGYSVGRPIEIAKTPMGYFYTARIGAEVDGGSAREVSDRTLVRELPDRKLMSFGQDYGQFLQFLEIARSELHRLPPAPMEPS